MRRNLYIESNLMGWGLIEGLICFNGHVAAWKRPKVRWFEHWCCAYNIGISMAAVLLILNNWLIICSTAVPIASALNEGNQHVAPSTTTPSSGWRRRDASLLTVTSAPNSAPPPPAIDSLATHCIDRLAWFLDTKTKIGTRARPSRFRTAIMIDFYKCEYPYVD